MTTYAVIENITGYLPDDDDPFVTMDYSQAVEVLRENEARWGVADETVIRVESDYASRDNLSSYRVIRTGHLLDVVGEIVICEEDNGDNN